MTRTYAVLNISAAAYDEIAQKLREAESDERFIDKDLIELHGLAVARVPTELEVRKARGEQVFPEPVRYQDGFWAHGVYRQSDGTMFYGLVIRLTLSVPVPSRLARLSMWLQGWRWVEPGIYHHDDSHGLLA